MPTPTARGFTPAGSMEPGSSAEVREHLVEALNLDLIGPWAGHAHAGERLPGWVRPSNWYLTGFLIPSGTDPERSADADEDDDLDETPASGGLAEESAEERRAAKKGFFPSSMGLSFLVAREADALAVIVRWGDYERAEAEDSDGKTVQVWQRRPNERTIRVPLSRTGGPQTGTLRTGDSRTGEPQTGAPRTGDSRTDEPQTGALRTGVIREPTIHNPALPRRSTRKAIRSRTPTASGSMWSNGPSISRDARRSRRGRARCRCSWSTGAARTGTTRTSPVPSRPRSRSAASAPSCPGPTCAARGPRIGTSRWPISTTRTPPSTPPVTVSPRIGRWWTAPAGSCVPRGSRAPTSKRRRRWRCPAPSFRWTRSGRCRTGGPRRRALRPLVESVPHLDRIAARRPLGACGRTERDARPCPR